MRVGADTGGTFTDVVASDGTVAKVLSTPDDPGRAVRTGLAAVGGGGRPEVLAHGTTVATNALLERRGAAVALITTRGFADVIEIARQDRPSLYDSGVDRPEPLVPRGWRYEVGGRLAADGTELEPIDLDELPALDGAVGSVAVCLLHADLDVAHEQAVAVRLRRQGHDVCCSHEVSPEFREYERTSTTVVNAYLRPVCESYLRGLDGAAAEVLVLTSAGGLVPAGEAAEVPASLLLSGPAGGMRAAAAVAVACGWPDALTFDMGGTSTDVCLVRDGAPQSSPQREAAGLPVRLPSLDIHTVGAGGGSVARIDAGGALVVGPTSAGAVPGPACYGRGGQEPTVTDADLALGRIPAAAALPGLGSLDVDAARTALHRAGVDAGGVVAVVDAGMEQALRHVSVARGVDPRELALVAFGGAGPLHACALAEALDMPVVIVPPRAGVLSAVGLLCSPVQHDLVRSWPTPHDHGGLEAALAEMADQARAELAGQLAARSEAEGPGGASAVEEVEVDTALDCRYAGQSHELTVPALAGFAAEHRRRNGFDRPEARVEVVALRARATRPAPLAVTDLRPPAQRQAATGPKVVSEPDCTIWVPEGWRADPGPVGALLLTRTHG
ncbi:MAG TPA: hydantoinase/oxoprolinase family protein [Acidimicrobiales bacterium]|nr:hydantoinase/oxoprolinase family protein [Acidimicrobiales bacterium]